jgi:hypothetical protein
MNHDVLSHRALRHGLHDFSLPALVLQQLIWATIEEIEDLEIVHVAGSPPPSSGSLLVSEFSFEAST